MTKQKRFYKGIANAARGYLFVSVEIGLNEIDFLPAFLGYIYYLTTINNLKEEEPELTLLHPICEMLVIWYGIDWVLGFVGLDLFDKLPYLGVLISVITMYFHFQMLTNIASIATKYQPKGCKFDVRLLRYRTIHVVLTTAGVVLSQLPLKADGVIKYVVFAMGAVQLVILVLMLATLHRLKKRIYVAE